MMITAAVTEGSGALRKSSRIGEKMSTRITSLSTWWRRARCRKENEARPGLSHLLTIANGEQYGTTLDDGHLLMRMIVRGRDDMRRNA